MRGEYGLQVIIEDGEQVDVDALVHDLNSLVAGRITHRCECVDGETTVTVFWDTADVERTAEKVSSFVHERFGQGVIGN